MAVGIHKNTAVIADDTAGLIKIVPNPTSNLIESADGQLKLKDSRWYHWLKILKEQGYRFTRRQRTYYVNPQELAALKHCMAVADHQQDSPYGKRIADYVWGYFSELLK